MKLNEYDVGAICGRFQVPELHEGHIKLIQEVCSRHNNRVIVFVGVCPVLGTKENPLDFSSRQKMIETAFPLVTVLPLADCKSDKVWSTNIDYQIRTIYPISKVCLYGGRDSFLKSYCGNMDAYEFPTHDYRPGKEIREAIGKEVRNSSDFRAGIIYCTQNQYKRNHFTIDVAIYRRDKKASLEILIGRKYNETQFRFIGGFVEGECFEDAVRREAQEEANCSLEGPIEYIASVPIRDWRYMNTSDSILTTFFASELSWGGSVTGEEKAGDDIEEICWIDLNDLYKTRHTGIVDNHRILVEKLFEYFRGKK